MNKGSASGLQVLFLIFAVALLAAPASTWLTQLEIWSAGDKAVINRGSALFLGAIILVGFPGLRRLCRAELSKPIPFGRRGEVAIAMSLQWAVACAAVGALLLTRWLLEGHTGMHRGPWASTPHEVIMARALRAPEIIKSLLIGGVLAPVVEELVFRGFLYRAWERRWGWVPAMLLTSTVFALYHPVFAPAFLGSLLGVCLYRRTGTLWAPIVCHSASNILLWYPLAGQWISPAGLGPAAGELSLWSLHLACLAITLIVLGIYVWMSRDAYQRSPACLDAHAALPR